MSKRDRNNKPISIEEVAIKTLKGDIRQIIVDRWRAQTKLFKSLSEADQRTEIQYADDAAEKLVRRVVGLVVGHEFPSVAVVMTGQFGVKDGLVTIKATCASTIDNLGKIARDGAAVLLMADPAAFYGQRAPTVADRDQPDILDGEEPETPEEKAKREAYEREQFEASEAARKAADAELRRAYLERARQAGWDAYGTGAGNIPPADFFSDEEASTAWLEAYQAHQTQAEGGKGRKKRGPKRDDDAPADADADEPADA